jgi:predicted TIM-barrel fold metal-dependent hydrolase
MQSIKANRHVCSMPLQKKFIDAHVRLERGTPTTPESVETPLLTQGFSGEWVSGNCAEDTSAERREYHLDGLVCTGNIPLAHDGSSAQIRQWEQAHGLRHAFVVQVDLLDPDIEKTLDYYAGIERITGVRQLMAWDRVRQPYRPGSINLLADPFWRKRLELLKRHDLRFGIEVLAYQLPDIVSVVRKCPGIGFTIEPMGWPLNGDAENYVRWKRGVADLADCDNVRVDVSALEQVFGVRWSFELAATWITTAIETIGVSRCMFASHMTASEATCGFAPMLARYGRLTQQYSNPRRIACFIVWQTSGSVRCIRSNKNMTVSDSPSFSSVAEPGVALVPPAPPVPISPILGMSGRNPADILPATFQCRFIPVLVMEIALVSSRIHSRQIRVTVNPT